MDAENLSESSRVGRVFELGLAVALFLAVVATFAPAFGNGFVAWDDDLNFLENPHFRGFGAEQLRWMFTSFHVGHYMPLTWLSCAIDYSIWGLDPRGYHATNILLHGANAVLAFRLFASLLERALRRRDRRVSLAAAAGAAFFSLHPLRVESVAWATERRDVLSLFFLLLSAASWLRSFDADAHRTRRRVAAHLWLVASLLSKVSGMTFVAALFAIDFAVLRRTLTREVWIEKLGFVLLGIGAAVLGWYAQRESTEVLASAERLSLAARCAIAARGACFYLTKTCLPFGLTPLVELEATVDPTSPRALVAELALAAITVACFLWRRRSPALLASWLTFVALLAPVSGLAQSGRQLAADRYSYLPSLALGALLASALELAARRGPRLTALLTGAALAGCAALSVSQTRVWHDSESLWRHALAVDDTSYFAHHKLGVVLHQSGRFDEAIAEYQRALALRPIGANQDAHYDLALSWLAKQQTEKALGELELALAADPRHVQALRVEESIYEQAGALERMLERYRSAIVRDDGFAEAHLGFARVALKLNRVDDAIAGAKRAVELAPASLLARNQLGLAYLRAGRAGDAEAELRRASELAPDNADVLANLGLALAKLGRADDARRAWQRALELDPNQRVARRELGSRP